MFAIDEAVSSEGRGACALPLTEIYRFRPEEGTLIMEFRLVYKGHLPSETNTSHPKVKHEIRKVFHKQLAELWKQTPRLQEQMKQPGLLITTPANMVSWPGPGVQQFSWNPTGKPWVEHLAEEYSRYGFRFVPLVRDGGISCALDILFLRRDSPGNIVKRGGDIDNRLKVLFDALRLVDNLSELAGATPESGEDPFFVLLQDDYLITEVSVTTDRLLTPMDTPDSIHDVQLIIRVRLTDPAALFVAGRLV